MQDVIRDWLLWFRLCRELIFCRYLYLLDLFTTHQFVISTEAQRSGETCICSIKMMQ